MTIRRRGALFGFFSAAAIALGLAQPAAAQESVEQFYSGQLLTILIGHPPGGSYDLYSQVTAQHIGKFIPGNPTVVVQSMPGGGGSVAAAYFYNRAPRDGSMIALFPETLAHTQLLTPEASRWDLAKMRYLGSFTNVASVLMVREGSAVKTVEDLYTTEAFAGCSGRTTASSQAPAIMRYFTGMKLKMVCGYEGGSATILALLRNEIDVNANVWTTWKVNHQAEMASGQIKPLVQFGLQRLPDLPDVPTMEELTDDPEAKAAMRFFSAAGDIGRALLAPPEMPDDRFAALTSAFDQMVKDPAFIADIEARGASLNPVDAAGVQAIVDTIFATPTEVVEELKVALEKGFEE
ncbi:MAG: Bug family tripartite tricarboxylate transporter substrate binding protein [Devosia sp.]